MYCYILIEARERKTYKKAEKWLIPKLTYKYRQREVLKESLFREESNHFSCTMRFWISITMQKTWTIRMARQWIRNDLLKYQHAVIAMVVNERIFLNRNFAKGTGFSSVLWIHILNLIKCGSLL
jgi:hypothetical protein